MRFPQVTLLFSVALAAAPAWGQNQIGGGNCTASSLNGTYALVLTGRAASGSGTLTAVFQSNGTAVFDGQSKVTFNVAANTNQAAAKALTYSGTYSVPSNCYGTLTLTTGSAAMFSLVVWNGGQDFNIVGQDATYFYSGSGATPPAVCATATLSGEYSFSANGFTFSSSAITGTADEAGSLQFDGQGNATASYVQTSGGPATSYTATGNYSVASGCTGSATLMDSAGKAVTLNFSVNNATGADFDMIASNTGLTLSGTAHSAFLNPSQSIGNVASYTVGATPPGSVFVVFGEDFAARVAQPGSVPLPTTLLTTSLMVNSEAAPLFYVDTGQIDAQMPWDIPGGTLATVVVKNGTQLSNAATVFVPSAGTPGISVYSTNRAVVVNADNSVNSASNGAKVGDEVVAYFTGGGPVQAAGKLVAGSPAPAGLSPVPTGANPTVTVGGQQAKIDYIGLTPGSIGLYQVNFVVPQLDKGTYALVITISGQASNNPVMTVSN
jgi:uncharacterized protein (TIGR03437 family)